MKKLLLAVATTLVLLMPEMAQAAQKKKAATLQESCVQAVADVSANTYRGIVAWTIVFVGALVVVYALARWRRVEKQKNQEYKELKALRT